MKIKNNKKVFIILGLFLLLMILPLSFASSDNTTAEVLEEDNYNNYDSLMYGSEDVYYNASADDNGDGSKDNPFKEFNNNNFNAQDGSTIHIANGEYDFNGYGIFTNMIFIGESKENTIVKNATFMNYYGGDSSIIINNITFINSSFIKFNEFKATNSVFKGHYEQGIINSATDEYSSTYASINLNNCSFIDCDIKSDDSLIQIYDGTLYLVNTNFEDNIANSSSLINVIAEEYETDLTIINSKFTNNTVDFGVVLSNMATLNITKTTFEKNHAKRFAGAIFATQSYLILDNNTFKDNEAEWSGGALITLDSSTLISNCKFNNNSALYSGGAVYAMLGNIMISSSDFIKNSALNGSAIFLDDVNPLYDGQPLSNNNKYEDNAHYSIYAITDNNYDFSKDNIDANDIYQSKLPNMVIGDGNYSLVKYTPTFNGTIPKYYDLRQKGWVTPVKNQGPDGNCWAFTGIATLESCILKAMGTTYDFSEVNMKNLMALFSDYGWNTLPNSGGTPDMAIAYLTSWLGPVYESDDPYSPSNSLSQVLPSHFHVQNVLFLNITDTESIKQAIIEYGAVGVGMAWDDTYINKITDAAYYCWNENADPNHAVTIIGWDDNYSRDNFDPSNKPEGNGAWIIKNSWGVDAGENGYFYVSYYDKVFGTFSKTYTFILNDTMKFDKNYQYDIQGHIRDTGYKNSVWYKNVFDATDDEYLAAVSTYFDENNEDYEISVYVNGQKVLNQSGVSKTGYYTINLNKIIQLNKGDKFEVVFKITTDETAYAPICAIYDNTNILLNKLLSKSGVSFISPDGQNWKDLYENSAVACLKAFTYLDIKTNIDLKFEDTKLTATVIDENNNIINTGNVTFTINNITEIIPIINGKATSSYDFTKYGIYNISASWNNTGYKPAKNNTTYETPWDVVVSAEYMDNKINVNIQLGKDKKLNDNVVLTIEDKKYNVKVNQTNTIYKITDKFDAGLHNITLTYANGDYIKSSTGSFLIKAESTLDDIIPFEYDYGQSGSVNITYSGAVNVVASIINHTEAIVSVNDNVITISNLAAGDYILNITTVPDENHTEISKTTPFTVNKFKVDLYGEENIYDYTYINNTEFGSFKVQGFVPSGSLTGLKQFTNFIAIIENQSTDSIIIRQSNIYFKNLKGTHDYNLMITLNETNYTGSKNFTIHISPTNTDLIIPDIIFDYGKEGNVNAITNASELHFDGDSGLESYITLKGKTIKVSTLNAGNYTIKLIASDENYTSQPVSVNIIVNSTSSSYLDDIEAFEYDYMTYGNITVNYNACGIIVSVVNHTEANITIINKTIIISNLTKGDYILNITTLPDANNSTISKSTTFKVYGLSFTDLQDLINNAQNNITLNHDYTYQDGDKVIEIPNNMTINGNNHAIYAKGKSNILKVTGDNVNIKNIILNGGKATNGGAIDWQGNNGTLDNSTLSNNTAESGGAINWQGNNGKILNSKFDNNNATTGASMMVNGNNLNISNSTFKSDIGNNNNNSIAISDNITELPIIDNATKQNGGNVVKAPVLTVNINNITYGETAVIKVTVKYYDELLNGTIFINGKSYSINGTIEIPLTNLDAGDYNYTVIFNGSDEYSKVNVPVKFTVFKQNTTITAKSESYIINYGGKYSVVLNTNVSGEIITITLNNKEYNMTTDNNGVASLVLTKSMLGSAGIKTINIIFKGSTNYNASSTKATITVNKEASKLLKVKSVKKAYKKNTKTKKVKATLKDSQGKILKNKVIYLKIKKVKGKKTIKAKTNNKGIVTFKLKNKKVKFTKKGKYKFTIQFKGDNYYKNISKKGIIKIK